MDWGSYCDWARNTTASGVSLLEIHGQGTEAEMDGKVLGVISQESQVSSLGDSLAGKFGRFPMDWRELMVSKAGGAVVESFETEYLESLGFGKKEETLNQIAADIALAVDATRRAEPPEYGCSASGCPRA